MSVLTMDLNSASHPVRAVVTEANCTVDGTTGATIAADHATKQTFMPVFKLVFFSQRRAAGVSFREKRAHRLSASSAGTHHVGFSATTETKTEGIYCNRFTRAWSASYYGHAAMKINLKLTNDSKKSC